MLRDSHARRQITRLSHYWFFLMYFPEYVKYPFADFHYEMFALTEDETQKMVAVMAFRGSSKSTIFTMSYPIWAVLGAPQKKFVLLVAQTQAQAKLYLTNLRRELEANELLRADLGPFDEREEEWSAGTLVIPKYGARITAISREQSIRGLRHGSHRPDLIICDDLEDLASVKTFEGRQNTYQWLMGDVIPCGDRGTKIVIVGNMLHEDSLLMRMKGEIEGGTRDGAFRRFPIIDSEGRPTWPGKLPTPADIETVRRSVDEAAWNREYVLEIFSGVERVIHPEWIQFHDGLPDMEGYGHNCLGIHEVMIGVDMAISETDMADYTAAVPVIVLSDYDGNWSAYVMPEIINERLSFPDSVARLKALAKSVAPKNHTKIYVEDVGLQRALAQQLQREGVDAATFGLQGLDKRSRIALTSALIKSGKILFPRHGAEELIRQLVGFGQEKHDDIADAFSLIARKILDRPPSSCRIYFL